MKNKYFLYIILILIVLFITGCPKNIGESCKNNDECITKNCAQSVCLQSDIGGYCKEDYHCLKGVCKYNMCVFGQKGDSCKSNNDCDQSKFECYNGSCVSKEWYCKIARFTNLAGGSFLLSIILLIIGGLGLYFGYHIIGANVKIGIITIGISIFVIAAAVGVFGIGIFATCF